MPRHVLRFKQICGFLFFGVLLAAASASAQTRYDEGASDFEIRIGNTNPYSGNASAFGSIGKTITAYFKMVNAKGGINGRKINFISYDDGYVPAKTVEFVRKLVEEDKVLMVFQTLGTPSNAAIQEYMNQKQVPQLFVASGASMWDQPAKYPWTMGWQPDYVAEAAMYATDIVGNVKNPKIAVLMQNDAYGKDYFNGFKQALGGDADKIVRVAVYEVTDATVDNHIVDLKNSGANVFFNITTPKFAVQAIKKAAAIGWRPVHYLNTVSASTGAVMRPAGLAASQGIISMAYLKDVTVEQWKSWPDVIEWNKFMDEYLPEGDRGSSFHVYGYATAATLAEVLRRSGNDLTRANVMKKAASLVNLKVPLLLPHVAINTSATNYNPIRSIRLQRFIGDRWDYSLAAWLAFSPTQAPIPSASPKDAIAPKMK